EYEGAYYVVGEKARFSGKRIEIAGIDELIKYYPLITKYVLEQLGIPPKKAIVITGLPPGYADRGKELTKIFSNMGIKSIIAFQGFGICTDVMDKFPSGLIIDIGFNTVDYLSYSVEEGRLIKELSGTIPNLGVITAVSIFRDLLPAQKGVLKTKPLSGLVNIFLEGKWRGEDLSQYKEKALIQWNEIIKARLRQELGILYGEKSDLIVAGGGAYLVRPEVFSADDSAPMDIYIPPEPEFSNARGYYKLGVSGG
ncbi:MAG: hypothetical protein ACO2OT_07355, partial [Candidatus Caldipriscus sp.]